jgi:hypothetical protein
MLMTTPPASPHRMFEVRWLAPSEDGTFLVGMSGR